MRKPSKRGVVGLTGVITLLLVVLWVVRRPTHGRLLDGTEVTLQKVSYGANHTAPKASFDQLFRHLPPEWRTRIKWKPSSGISSTTVRSNFTFWFKFSNPDASKLPITYAIADENDFEAPMLFDGPYLPYVPGGFSNSYVGLVRGTSIFPRRSRNFFVRLYQQTAKPELLRVAEFAVPNDGFQDGPRWEPEELPILHRTNGLEFAFVKAEVGGSPPGKLVAPYDRQVGEWSEFRFRVSSQGEPSAGWVINEIWMSEANGSQLRTSAQDLSAFNRQFSWTEGDEIVCVHRWPYWSGEPAWKLRVRFEQAGEQDCWIEYLVHPKFLNPR